MSAPVLKMPVNLTSSSILPSFIYILFYIIITLNIDNIYMHKYIKRERENREKCQKRKRKKREEQSDYKKKQKKKEEKQ